MLQYLETCAIRLNLRHMEKCYFSSTRIIANEAKSFKLVIVGGGSGGATMASRLIKQMGEGNIAVIEPSDVHYYQPYWTLVGAGLKNFSSSHRPMASVLPNGVKWIKDSVITFIPSENMLLTKSNTKIKYEFLIVAMGMQTSFEKIKGLPEAFESPGVCSNYSPYSVEKTAKAISQFSKGNAVFTQPVNPIKCAGAPQKILYLTEDIFKKTSRRDSANMLFYTALDAIFSAPKYAEALRNVAQRKGICVNYGHNLIEIKSDVKQAVFQKLKDKSTVTVEYSMLHVTPPMVAPSPIRASDLCDSSGFLDVDKYTLQHKSHKNIFGIGDCTNVPTSKTAAAVAGQCGILTENIMSAFKGNPLLLKYNGYTSCPLVTGQNKGILAEFDFDLQPLETLPIDQSKERYISFIIKKDILPKLYWNMMLKGHWKGPSAIRRALRLGLG